MNSGFPPESASTSDEVGPLTPAPSRRRAVVTGAMAVALFISFLTVASGTASASSPKLTITPSEIYYPCSEGGVDFAVKGFGADKKVKLHFGSATGPKEGNLTTNASGKASKVKDFDNTPPGSYTYYAVGGGVSANATLVVGACP